MTSQGEQPPRGPSSYGPGGGAQVYLSPPDVGEEERRLLLEAFDSNWIAPLGPHVDGFEAEMAEYTGARHAVALSSGTAALHLALLLVGVKPGDEVLVSTLTFVASVNPILYVGAVPVFVDSEEVSWNLDADLLEEELVRRARNGTVPKALVLVHLYGQCADLPRILEIADRFGVPLIEDAAEALGATCGDRSAGTFGSLGCFSFNGNKIITTSGGGMLVTDDPAFAARARKLATQAREPVRHYEHREMGYNYRLSNLLAALGRAQLRRLDELVENRRRVFEGYQRLLGHQPGLSFMPEAPWGRHTRWLTTLKVDAEEFGADRNHIIDRLEAERIEARPVWKPMHLQPIFSEYPTIGGTVAETLFRDGLCLPSGAAMSDADVRQVAELVLDSCA